MKINCKNSQNFVLSGLFSISDDPSFPQILSPLHLTKHSANSFGDPHLWPSSNSHSNSYNQLIKSPERNLNLCAYKPECIWNLLQLIKHAVYAEYAFRFNPCQIHFTSTNIKEHSKVMQLPKKRFFLQTWFLIVPTVGFLGRCDQIYGFQTAGKHWSRSSHGF